MTIVPIEDAMCGSRSWKMLGPAVSIVPPDGLADEEFCEVQPPSTPEAKVAPATTPPALSRLRRLRTRGARRKSPGAGRILPVMRHRTSTQESFHTVELALHLMNDR